MTARLFLTCALAVGCACPAKAGVVVLDQPHDFVAFSPSEQGTAVPFARTADDFLQEYGTFFMESVTVEMIVSFPDSPRDFALEIHFGDTPSQPILVHEVVSSVVDHGPWNGNMDMHHFSITFDTGGQQLLKGRYWFSPYAIGNGSGTDRAWWGTAGKGVVNGSEGYFISEHFGVPDWTPISKSGILDFPTDFAMTTEAGAVEP
jgi:hypothetical protein